MAEIREMPRTRPVKAYDVENSEERAHYAPVVTTQDARSGETSGRMRTVLTASLVLILVAFTILYATYF